MLSNKSDIKNILVVSLTNIGDVILTFPVIDILMEKFPNANVSVVIGPKAESLFDGNPNIKNVLIYNKKLSGIQTFKWVMGLKKEKYDCVVDLRHTVIGMLVGAKHRTSIIRNKPKSKHMREKHLAVLKKLFSYEQEAKEKKAFVLQDGAQKYIQQCMGEHHLHPNDFVVIAAGAADPNKRWPMENFASLADNIAEHTKLSIVFVGSVDDDEFVKEIQAKMKNASVNLCGEFTLVQLGGLFAQSQYVISNDSGPMHLASYLNAKVLAIFGPTDACKYGPWSSDHRTIQNLESCPRCDERNSALEHICMSNVTVAMALNCLKLEDKNISNRRYEDT